MNLWFYYDLPSVQGTMLTWTLSQELILLGYNVMYGIPKEGIDIPRNVINWVVAPGKYAGHALKFARAIGAKIHVHDEGAPPWRVGLENATDWGYENNLSPEEIQYWKRHYTDYMGHMFQCDSCSLNGKQEFEIVEKLFGKKLKNGVRLCSAVDARAAAVVPKPKSKDKKYAITISRLEQNKGVFKIAEALALLDPKERPDLWIVIGYGSKEQIARLEELTNKNKIRCFLTSCYGFQKWVYIKQSSIMLQGYSGIPPAEGLLCDIPVVVFDHPHMHELFDNVLTYAKDTQDFAAKIKEGLQNGVPPHQNKQRLLNGNLYMKTQEQLAKQYDTIFRTTL